MRVQFVKKLTDKQQVARIERIMVPWLRRLDLFNTWEILVELVAESELPCHGDAEYTYALVTVNAPYRRAAIEVNRHWAAKSDDTELEHNLLHELVHILLGPLVNAVEGHVPEPYKPQFQQAHESVTDAITHLLLWDSSGKRNR